MRTVIFLAAGFVLLSGAAGAQRISRSPHGDEFLQDCQQGDKACPWLILGLAETLNAFNASGTAIPPKGFDACIPADAKADDIVRNVVGLMLTGAKVSPELYRTTPASPLIISTLAQAYPCKR